MYPLPIMSNSCHHRAILLSNIIPYAEMKVRVSCVVIGLAADYFPAALRAIPLLSD